VLLDKICRENGMAFEGALRSAPQLLGEQLAAVMSRLAIAQSRASRTRTA